MNKNIPEKYMVTERGKWKPGTPRSIQFPATISTLKTYMGFKKPDYPIYVHGKEWKGDRDYFFQMGVSTEGFGLCYGMDELIESGKWNNEPLDDCFLSEGIEYRLVADDSIKIKDDTLNIETIKNEVVNHLNKDLPVILIRKHRVGRFKIATGYIDFGNVLMARGGSGKVYGFNKATTEWHDWIHKICAVIFIDDITEPIDRKEVVLRALSRAYAMLTEETQQFNEYGYGKPMWDKWISRLDNDNNYKAKSSILKFMVPEKFDLAERRMFGAEFLNQAQEITNEDFSVASQAFCDIHDKMWIVHWMVKGKNEGNY